MENLRSSTRNGLHASRFQYCQSLLRRDSRLTYHPVEFDRRKRLDADAGQLVPDTANHLGIIVQVMVGMHAAHDMHLRRTAAAPRRRHGDHLVHRVVPRPLLAPLAAERAEFALQSAYIGRLDMEIAVVEHLVAAHAPFRLEGERPEQPQRCFHPQFQCLVGGQTSAVAQFRRYVIHCHTISGLFCRDICRL